MSYSSDNPYAPPTTDPSAEAPMSDAEAMRHQYLSHEASVKSIGQLYMIGAITIAPIGLITVIGSVAGLGPFDVAGNDRVALAIVGCVYFGLGIWQAATAIGLRSLQTWSRIMATVLSVMGLVAIAIGTLISIYFLYLLLSNKGSVVFSREYKQVIAATPHIKYRTSKIMIFLLALLLILLAMGIGAALFG